MPSTPGGGSKRKRSLAPVVVFGGIAMIAVIGLIVVAVSYVGRDDPYLDSTRLTAPTGGQTFKQGIVMICSTHQRIPGYKKLNEAERDGVIGDWWRQNIQAPKARAALTALTNDPDDGPAILRKAAAEVGLPSCPFVDVYYGNADPTPY